MKLPNHSSSMLHDFTNPENMMFHCKGEPPLSARIITSSTPSKIVLISLVRITDYLMEFVALDNFVHTCTSQILRKGKLIPMNEDCLIVRLGYEEGQPRKMTFQLSLDKAIMNMH